MATLQKVTLSSSRDIPFEEHAEDIARRGLRHREIVQQQLVVELVLAEAPYLGVLRHVDRSSARRRYRAVHAACEPLVEGGVGVYRLVRHGRSEPRADGSGDEDARDDAKHRHAKHRDDRARS